MAMMGVGLKSGRRVRVKRLGVLPRRLWYRTGEVLEVSRRPGELAREWLVRVRLDPPRLVAGAKIAGMTAGDGAAMFKAFMLDLLGEED